MYIIIIESRGTKAPIHFIPPPPCRAPFNHSRYSPEKENAIRMTYNSGKTDHLYCTEIHWGGEALSPWSVFEAADKTQGPIQRPDKSPFIPKGAHLGASDKGWAMRGRAPATRPFEVGKGCSSRIETFSCDFLNDSARWYDTWGVNLTSPLLLLFCTLIIF